MSEPKKPQDHKKKAPVVVGEAVFTFEHDGETYVLPKVTEKAAGAVPSWIMEDALLDPDDQAAQARLFVATLRAVEGVADDSAEVLRTMPFAEKIELGRRWMGESRGSSD